MNVLDTQRRLLALGFNPGPLDGIMGRRTIAAVKEFQASKGLTADGVVGAKTTAALNAATASAPSIVMPAAPLSTEPPWLALARTKLGLTETANKTTLWSFLKSDKRSVGDPSKLPWCGDFVETCIAVTLPGEVLPTNPYLARNWQKFGVKLSKPAVGAVMVFWRTSLTGSTDGHVGFCVGEDGAYWLILGGNQSNAVTISKVAKNRLLGAYWPKTFPLPSSFALPVGMASARVSVNEA
jgi:uncharacterized protein (TIGR02594 family)